MPNIAFPTRAELLAVFKTDKLARLVEDMLRAITVTLPGAADGVQANLDAHIADTADAHQASAIGAIPGGSRLTNTVAGQIGELDAGKQPLDATLTALSGVVTAADRLVYATGVDAFAVTPFSAFARTLLDDVDAATMRATIGAGTGSGDVVGPASSVNGRVAIFSGVTGKLIADSGLTLSGTNTGDQTITLTGDVTGSGTGSFAATIPVNTVTYAKMQDVSATSRILGRRTAGAGDPEEITATQALDFIGSTQGQILFRDAANWNILAPGTAGQVLKTGGAGANPSWAGTGEMLANVTLGVAGTSLSSGTFAARKFLEIHIYLPGYAGSDTASLQFNATAGTGYRYRWATMAAGGVTWAAGLLAASTDRVKIAAANTTSPRRVVCWINNDSGVTEKLVKFESQFGTGSAATQDTIDLGQGAWISGAATQITRVDLISSSNMLAGTQMTIFGWN